jgi:hypothetical protein
MKFLERLNQMADEAVKTIDTKVIRLVTLYEQGGAKAVLNAIKNQIEKNLDYTADYLKEQHQRYEDEKEARAFRNKKEAHDEDINPVMQALDNIICKHRTDKAQTRKTIHEMTAGEILEKKTVKKSEDVSTNAVIRTMFMSYNTDYLLRVITFDESLHRNTFVNQMIRLGLDLAKEDQHLAERRELAARKVLTHENGLLHTIYLDIELDDILHHEAMEHKINKGTLIEMYLNLGIRHRTREDRVKEHQEEEIVTAKSVVKKVARKTVTKKTSEKVPAKKIATKKVAVKTKDPKEVKPVKKAGAKKVPVKKDKE